jgi:uncharacterized DUF497 family protein
MSDSFDWDDANRSHIARHGVAAEEAEQVLVNNPLDLDPQYINDEWRFPSVGLTRSGRWLVVVATVRGGKTRVLASFDAPKNLIAVYLMEKSRIS